MADTQTLYAAFAARIDAALAALELGGEVERRPGGMLALPA